MIMVTVSVPISFWEFVTVNVISWVPSERSPLVKIMVTRGLHATISSRNNREQIDLKESCSLYKQPRPLQSF